MTLEVEVKFAIGDMVKVLNPGDRFSKPFIAYVSGYVIHTGKTGTKVYYTVEEMRASGAFVSVNSCGHKRRYGASALELVEDKE